MAIRTVILIFLSVVSVTAVSAQTSTMDGDRRSGPVHQLRMYEIFERNKAAFHDRFRDNAARIMKRYNFHIVAIWESRKDDRTEFVYLIEWPDEVTMKDRWAKFMGDKEWSDIKKETGAKEGPMVGDIQDRTLRLTEYSPRRTLLNKR